MLTKGLGLPWIAVSDLEQAKKFYVDLLGFRVHEENKEYGWLEVENGGTVFGICQVGKCDESGKVKPGQNAILTFIVGDIEQARKEMEKSAVRFVDKIVEMPGVFRMTTFVDKDGNMGQLYQSLQSK